MACRVGITTDLDRRKAEWKQEYPNLRNWKIENEYETKTEAQAEENRIAKKRGCKSSPGGDGDEHATWYVYSFEYDDDVLSNWWDKQPRTAVRGRSKSA